MILLEYSSKKILGENLINIPRGILIHSIDGLPSFNFPFVVKAQVPFGGRGKRGLVREISTEKDFFDYVSYLFSKPVEGYTIREVLVEEKINAKEEFYLSFTVNRNLRNIRLIFSSRGGMEIENVDRSLIHSFDIDPFVGIQKYMARKMYSVFLRTEIGRKFPYEEVENLLNKLYIVFLKYNATLLEINPLALTEDGQLCALDAKIVIDDNAEDTKTKVLSTYGEVNTFEVTLSKYGVNATRLDGNIAVVTSGAGLMMATVDLISTYGGRVGPCVDLGGSVFRLTKEEHMFSEVIDQIVLQKPKVIFFNAFFQLARCDIFAQAIVGALSRVRLEIPVVIRLKGVHEEDAAEILREKKGFILEENLGDACKMVSVLAGDV